MWLRWTKNNSTRGRKGCSLKYSQSVALLKEQQKHSKRVLFLVGNNKGNAQKKAKIHTKKVWKCKCRSFEKGIAKTKSVVPLEKE